MISKSSSPVMGASTLHAANERPVTKIAPHRSVMDCFEFHHCRMDDKTCLAMVAGVRPTAMRISQAAEIMLRTDRRITAETRDRPSVNTATLIKNMTQYPYMK